MSKDGIVLWASSALLLVCSSAACKDAAVSNAGSPPKQTVRRHSAMAVVSGDRASVDPDAGPTDASIENAGSTVSSAQCSAASDCPSHASPCTVSTCNDGVCGVTFRASGTELPQQTPGDCRVAVCGPRGEATTEQDDLDVPQDDGNECTTDTCSAGSARHLPEPSGAACAQAGGKVCDGHGACVQCVLPGECPSQVCQRGECRPAVCENGMLDPGETDTDCGGDCGGCGPEQRCLTNADCAGKECTLDLCVANCADGIRNNAESGEDCGASCPLKLCANGISCKGAEDCSSGLCDPKTSKCATPPTPTCSDGIRNGTEVSTDCGGVTNGVTCPACPACTDNWECGLGVCYDHACVDGVNGCTLTNSTDLSGMVTASLTAPVAINFGDGAGSNYAPRCIKVTMGTKLAFIGDFSSHPLVGGVVNASAKQLATTGPFLTSAATGTSKEFTMDDCGAYPYYCDNEALAGMTGAVIVLSP